MNYKGLQNKIHDSVINFYESPNDNNYNTLVKESTPFLKYVVSAKFYRTQPNTIRKMNQKYLMTTKEISDAIVQESLIEIYFEFKDSAKRNKLETKKINLINYCTNKVAYKFLTVKQKAGQTKIPKPHLKRKEKDFLIYSFATDKHYDLRFNNQNTTIDLKDGGDEMTILDYHLQKNEIEKNMSDNHQSQMVDILNDFLVDVSDENHISMQEKYDIDAVTQNIIIKKYQNPNITLRELAKTFNMSVKSVTDAFKKVNIKLTQKYDTRISKI